MDLLSVGILSAKGYKETLFVPIQTVKKTINKRYSRFFLFFKKKLISSPASCTNYLPVHTACIQIIK